MTLVIVVDDDRGSLQLFRLILERAGFDVLVSDYSMRGYALIQQHKPPIAVLNDNMPVMTGGDMSRRIKTDPELAHIKVILCSAGIRISDPQYVAASMADFSLAKPFAFQSLVRVINEMLCST